MPKKVKGACSGVRGEKENEAKDDPRFEEDVKVEVGPGTTPQELLHDLCINCNSLLLKSSTQKVAHVLRKGLEEGDDGRGKASCSRREVSVLQALQVVFKLSISLLESSKKQKQIPTCGENDDLQQQRCPKYFVCRRCGDLLETAYNAVEDFKLLASRESMLSGVFGTWNKGESVSSSSTVSVITEGKITDLSTEETPMLRRKRRGPLGPLRNRMRVRCQRCKKRFLNAILLNKHSKVAHARKKGTKHQHPRSPHLDDSLKEEEVIREPSVKEEDNIDDKIDQELESPKGKKFEYKCDFCGKLFGRPDHWQLHLRTHTGEKPFSCGNCGKTFSDPRGLAFHEITHSNERPYCCTICGQTFKRRHHLNDHERNHRDVPRPFNCTLCGKAFKYKKHLNSHAVIHRSKKEYKCDICSKAFNRKDNLQQHIRKVHHKHSDKTNRRRGRETVKQPGPDITHPQSGTPNSSSTTVTILRQLKLEDQGQNNEIILSIPDPSISTNHIVGIDGNSVGGAVPTTTSIPVTIAIASIADQALEKIVYMHL